MKLSLVFELLMIFVLLAFAASKNIHKQKNNIKGLRNKDQDDNIKIEDNSLNRYCRCSESLCNCCRDFAVPVVNLNGPGCASLRYLEGDKMSISLSFGKKVITNRTVASRKPSPVCMPLPGGVSKFCGRVYNIAKTGEEFRACLGLELQAKSTVEAAVRVSCFKFGPRGVTSEPADPLPLVPQDETEKEDDDDDEDDDFGLAADDDDDDADDDDDDDDDEDDGGGIDAVNDVDTDADYTGFSILGEDLLGGLFGSSGTKKPNKNRNKQVQVSTSSTTTRRPRPNRRTTRKPNTRTTPKPITRSTTVRVRPVNRRPTRRPARRPVRRPTASTESFPISNLAEAASSSVSASTESTKISQSTNAQSVQNIAESNEKINIGNDKKTSVVVATTPITATSFEDSGLEMSLAHITGQLAVMPVTQIIPTVSENKASQEQMYEKIQTITPKPHSTIPFATEVDDGVNEDMVQIVQSLDSHSAEHISDKEANADESRGHHYEGLVLPKKKHRGEQFELEDLDVLDLTKIGESVGHQLGIFGRNKRQNQNKHKKHRNGNADYDIVGGLDAINESLGLPDIEVARRRSEFITKEDRNYDIINFRVPEAIWKEAFNPTPVLKSPVTIVVPISVAENENEVNYEEDNEVLEDESPDDPTPVSEQPVDDIGAVSVTSVPEVTQKPTVQDDVITQQPEGGVNGTVIRFPCNCMSGQCGCCTGAVLERFRTKACGNISFIPEDFVFDVKLSINNNTVIRRRVSASDPPPICINPRRAPFIRVCAEISNIRVRNGNAFACLDINADIAGFTIYSASFRCFGLGSSGVQTGLKPKPVSSGPKPVNLFGSSNQQEGTILDAAGAILGGQGSRPSGGLFGGGNDGPLDAIGDAIETDATTLVNLEDQNVELLNSSHILISKIKMGNFSIFPNARQDTSDEEDESSTPNRRCNCAMGVCKCCTGYVLNLFNQKACMKVTYHPGDFAFDVAMSMNDRILYENSMSGKNPRPICINPPRMPNLKVCARFYNVFFPGRNFHFCLGMTGKFRALELFNLTFDCLRMGANGIVRVKPEENGGLPIPNPQGGVDAVIDAGEDDIEEYDEQNIVRSLLEVFDR
ncbi:unnamed protein product [Leptosia nina]|uniref:DUF4773 domain-containing protein n=1 Tax=Leptosia nina TaxID=320188 RepID=A0AAV1J806_9NEOP